jgi:hypothetical protein
MTSQSTPDERKDLRGGVFHRFNACLMLCVGNYSLSDFQLFFIARDVLVMQSRKQCEGREAIKIRMKCMPSPMLFFFVLFL